VSVWSPNRKSLVKHQPAKSVNPAARRFGNSASPRPQIDCFSPAGRISPEKRACVYRLTSTCSDSQTAVPYCQPLPTCRKPTQVQKGCFRSARKIIELATPKFGAAAGWETTVFEPPIVDGTYSIHGCEVAPRSSPGCPLDPLSAHVSPTDCRRESLRIADFPAKWSGARLRNLRTRMLRTSYGGQPFGSYPKVFPLRV
jgi:hypothetical protein